MRAGSGRTARAGDRYKWVALSNTRLAVFMSALDGSIVIIALPAIFRGPDANDQGASHYDACTAAWVVGQGRREVDESSAEGVGLEVRSGTGQGTACPAGTPKALVQIGEHRRWKRRHRCGMGPGQRLGAHADASNRRRHRPSSPSSA